MQLRKCLFVDRDVGLQEMTPTSIYKLLDGVQKEEDDLITMLQSIYIYIYIRSRNKENKYDLWS